MHKRPENEDREGAGLWYAYHTLTDTLHAAECQEETIKLKWVTRLWREEKCAS